jgi:putative peptide zinc metalloprotease protein
MGYALACINMNPLLELDGYYIAMDLLEVPNLRARAFACLGALIRKRPPAIEDRRLRRVLMVFGAASVIYGAAMAVGIVLVCHAKITSLAGMALPFAGVQAIGWGGAGTVGLLLLTKLVGELRILIENHRQHGAIRGPVGNGESGHNSRRARCSAC